MNDAPPKMYTLEWLARMIEADMAASLRQRADYRKDGDEKTALYYAGKQWGLFKAREYVRACMEARE